MDEWVKCKEEKEDIREEEIIIYYAKAMSADFLQLFEFFSPLESFRKLSRWNKQKNHAHYNYTHMTLLEKDHRVPFDHPYLKANNKKGTQWQILI